MVHTDVADPAEVERLASAAVDHFGRIDTWVNNAGFGHAGTIENLDVAEIDRLIRVDLLGTIYGTKAAIARMVRQGGGTIVNVSSVAGVRGVPLQAVYCAAKHGIKGFTEAVRLEQERAGSGVRLTLILPTAINTPFWDHARSKTGKKLTALKPIYQPEDVADSIVFAAEHPRRDIFVGGSGKMMDVLQRISPALLDWRMLHGDRAVAEQQADGSPETARENAFEPADDEGPVHGEYDDEAKATSLYTRTFEWYPMLKPLAAGTAALGVFALLRHLGGNGHHPARDVAERAAQAAKHLG